MRETSARLLRLLTLLQARPDWTGPELARRLEITSRTLRRDVQKLRGLGYPVEAAPGVAGGYRLGAGTALPPLLLDDDEAVAVVLSLRTAASHTVTGMGEASLRALSKLEQVLPTRLRERTRALGHATVPLTGPVPTVDAALLTMIATACRSRERLAVRYRSHGGELTDRLIEPHRLVQAGYRWYLVARDTGRDAWRTFRVDRIGAPRLTGVRFTPADPPDAAAFVAEAVTTAPYRYRVRVLLHQPAGQIAERLPPTVGVLTPVGQDRCLLRIGADSIDAIIFHLGMLDCDFTVLEPAELTGRVRELAARLHAAVADPAGQAAAPPGQLHGCDSDAVTAAAESHPCRCERLGR